MKIKYELTMTRNELKHVRSVTDNVVSFARAMLSKELALDVNETMFSVVVETSPLTKAKQLFCIGNELEVKVEVEIDEKLVEFTALTVGSFACMFLRFAPAVKAEFEAAKVRAKRLDVEGECSSSESTLNSAEEAHEVWKSS